MYSIGAALGGLGPRELTRFDDLVARRGDLPGEDALNTLRYAHRERRGCFGALVSVRILFCSYDDACCTTYLCIGGTVAELDDGLDWSLAAAIPCPCLSVARLVG